MIEHKDFLIDGHGRKIDYLRIAVTDKCNLRCFYCMPEEGIKYVSKNELLSFEELLRISKILVAQGIKKIRITGGEPFLRKDIMSFINKLSSIDGLKKIAITTNGTLILQHIDELLDMGVKSYNLSMDSIQPENFYKITRRDVFPEVWNTFETLSNTEGVDLRINCVVMDGKNIDELIPMVDLTKDRKIAVRFIEEMPFNGVGSHYDSLPWHHTRILEHISNHYGSISKMNDDKNSTSINYKVPNFQGSFGVIPAYSRTFCGSCNRLRLTPQGTIKTCLYDDGIFNLRDLIRNGANDHDILEAIGQAISHKAKDGFEAEKNRVLKPFITESMSTIGG